MSTSPAILALLCLVASGLLDLVFKLYATQPRSRGMLVFGTGCVWFGLQYAYINYTNAALTFEQATILFGLLAAVFVTLSNILLLECLGQLPISMASTIYRLNTIPLVILAFFFLAEEMNSVKLTGIAAGLITVLLLYQPNHSNTEQSEKGFVLFVVLIIAASCIRALYGIVTKAGVSNGGDANTMMLLAAIGWCIGGLAYAYFREKRVQLTSDKLVFIPIAGFLVFSIVWLLTTSLTLGEASVVVPLANMGFVAAFIFSVILQLEKLTYKKILAIGSAVIAIALLTSTV